jgi:hypothetical protein
MRRKKRKKTANSSSATTSIRNQNLTAARAGGDKTMSEKEEIMNNDNKNDRRNFLKAAGAALVAAAVPAAVLAQKNDARPSGNNLKQMIVFGGIAEPNPNLPGIFGQACFQFQMQAVLGAGGYGTISDPVLTAINSHIEIHSGRSDLNDIYIFQGTCRNSQSSEMIGKAVAIKVQVLGDGNCNVSLTVEGTPIAGLLLPAVQKIRVPIYG